MAIEPEELEQLQEIVESLEGCLGRMQDMEMAVPPPDQPYECPRCGVELETEDFWIAQVKGSV